AVIPDFTFTTPDGQQASLLDVVGKNRLTLIDFWASWCKPCRAEIPNIKRAYEAFREKGFGILGISTDARESDWKKALEEDGVAWTMGLDNIVHASREFFDINAIPSMALV